jgi:hypothetical protein
MSTSRSSRSAVASAHPTRQQLDELDALLQRMLELPVNQVEEPSAAPPVEPRSTPTPRLARSAPPVLPPAPAPLRGPSPAPETGLSRPRVSPPPQPKPVPQPEPAAEDLAPPPPKGMEPRVLPAPEEPEQAPAASLPVQPPHLFRKRAQTSVEESLESEPAEPPDTDEQGEDWVPLRSSWKPSPHTWPPLAESWHQAQHTTSERPLVRRDEPVTAEPASPMEAKLAATQETQALPTAIPLPSGRPAGPVDGGRQSLADEPPTETIIYPRPTFPFSETAAISPNRIIEPKVSVPVDSGSAEDQDTSTPWLLRPLVWLNCSFNAVIALAGPPGRWLTGPVGRMMLGVVGILCLVGAVGLLVADLLGWTW